MAKDTQHKPEDEDASDAPLHAADEPTAVWDAEMLRQAGLDTLGDVPEPDSPPATAAQQTAPSILIDASATNSGSASDPASQAKRSGLSWPTTLALAAAFGALVYTLIRYLR